MWKPGNGLIIRDRNQQMVPVIKSVNLSRVNIGFPCLRIHFLRIETNFPGLIKKFPYFVVTYVYSVRSCPTSGPCSCHSPVHVSLLFLLFSPVLVTYFLVLVILLSLSLLLTLSLLLSLSLSKLLFTLSLDFPACS